MIRSNDKANPTLCSDKKTNVEEPILDQPAGLGWDVIRLQQVQTRVIKRRGESGYLRSRNRCEFCS